MANAEVKEFAGGNVNQRDHLNKVVAAVNGHEKRIGTLENKAGNPQNIIALSALRDTFVNVQIKDALLQGAANDKLPGFYTSHNGVAVFYRVQAVEAEDPQGII